MYTIDVGTKGKLITLEPNKDAKVEDWVVRKHLEFVECLISPLVVDEKVRQAQNQTLAVRLASEGYALFGGQSGSDRLARYVIAIPYDKIQIS